MASDLDATTVVLLLLGALLLLPLLTMGMGFGGMMGWPMMGGGMWGGGAGTGGTVPGWVWLVGLLTRLVIVAAVVGVGYLLFRAITRAGDDGDGALEELRRAYARGDLSDEEYERRRETLERDR